jgi:serine phosphatase RsbU (regulator of sigma subunit)
MRVPRVRRLTAAVLGISAALTLGLAWAAQSVNAHSNRRLLAQQVHQAAATLSSALPVVQSQLVQAARVAGATGADPQIFQRFIRPVMAERPSLAAISLWQLGDGGPRQLAIVGSDLALVSQHRDASFFARVHPSDSLFVTTVLTGSPARLGYAEMPLDGQAGLVVYAESVLPAGRHVALPKSSPFADLEFALYLGPRPDPDQLLEATGPVPIRGDSASASVPFGDTVITVVATPTRQLAGVLSAALPWIVLGAGGALTLATGSTMEFVARRRTVAERLARDNERLYRQQRDIAVTLQHALLPDVPDVEGVEIAARYLAGVAGMEVGGDWYDVIFPDKEHLVFFVGDVSGRGLAAATTMASLRYSARAYISQGDDIETVLTRLGGLLDIETDHQVATLRAGEIDLVHGRITLASAGHYAPLLITPEGARFVAIGAEPPIGIVVPAPATTVSLDVAGEVTLLAFTDGAVERRGEPIDVGLDRLRRAAAAGHGPLQEFVDGLVSTVVPDGADDDVVMLGLRWQV